MKYTLGSSAPSYIFHNQHKSFNNLYLLDAHWIEVDNYFTREAEIMDMYMT